VESHRSGPAPRRGFLTSVPRTLVDNRLRSLLAQPLIQSRLPRLQVRKHLEVTACNFAHIDLVDVHQPQEFPYGFGHGPTAFVAGSAALRDADAPPELLLIQAQPMADVAGIDALLCLLHFGVISV